MRGRWVPGALSPLCPSSSPRRGACAISPHPGVHGFPGLGLLCPLRLFVRAWAFRWGLPGLLPTRLDIPHEVSRVRCRRLKRHGGGGVLLAAPSALCGSPVPRPGRSGFPECRCMATHCSGPYSGVAPTISGVTGWHRRQGMPGAPVPVGLCTLQVIHHVIPQPNTPSWRLVSSAWCLSGPCCSPRRVVCDAEAQGLMGYLYTPRCYHILPHRFHGAQRRRSVGCWASAPLLC